MSGFFVWELKFSFEWKDDCIKKLHQVKKNYIMPRNILVSGRNSYF